MFNRARLHCGALRVAIRARPAAKQLFSTLNNSQQSVSVRSAGLGAQWPGFVVGTILGGLATWLAHVAASPQAPSSADGQNYGTADDFQRALAELQQVLPADAVSTHSSDLVALGSLAPKSTNSHGAVVRPRSTEEVQRVVLVARKYHIPIITHGSGTSLEGQANPQVRNRGLVARNRLTF